MAAIQNILFPVDFSPSCVAMAPFVQRAAIIFGARVTLMHVFDLYRHDAVQLCVRPLSVWTVIRFGPKTARLPWPCVVELAFCS